MRDVHALPHEFQSNQFAKSARVIILYRFGITKNLKNGITF